MEVALEVGGDGVLHARADDPTLRCALDVIDEDRVMFSVDHPFSDSAVGTRWLADTPIGDEARAKVAHANADRLLKLAAADA